MRPEWLLVFHPTDMPSGNAAGGVGEVVMVQTSGLGSCIARQVLYTGW